MVETDHRTDTRDTRERLDLPHTPVPVRPELAHASEITSHQEFNAQFRLASQRPGTAQVTEFNIGNANLPSDKLPVANSTSDHFDKRAPIPMQFRNLNASSEFGRQVESAANEMINKLNPQSQALLRGLNVMTADKVSAIDPREKHEPAALYTERQPPYPNSVVFFEKEIHKRGISPNVVAMHELSHPLDKNDRFSGSPEFRRAYDLGFNRIPKSEKDELLKKFPPSQFPKPALRAEFFADVLAQKLGNTPEQTAYAKNLLKYFPEASDYVQRKFLDR